MAFAIWSLLGGLNNTDAPSALEKDQCTIAENVEFFESMLGEKRKGAFGTSLPSAVAANTDLTETSWLYQNAYGRRGIDTELWALFTGPPPSSPGDNFAEIWRKAAVWAQVTPFDTIDAGDVDDDLRFRMSAVSIHGKMHHMYRSVSGSTGIDRAHVWDSTQHRRTGLVAPAAAPSVANDGGVGTFDGKRFYRVRYLVMSGSTILRRSEPTDATEFTPNGNDTGAVITKPAATSPSEGETHWEVEASINDADYYLIATVVVGTTTYTDSISAYTTGYAATGTLSATIGDYTPPWSAKFVVADDDRVLFAGSWEDTTLGSRVAWTPVFGDVTGVGNDERIPIETVSFIDLDALEGGEITAISQAVNGYIFVFKRSRIYKLSRTDNVNRAYKSICITKTRGALPGSLIEGIDENGTACLDFLDPNVGCCRLGTQGLQWCGADIQTTWDDVNVDAILPCFGLFYPKKHQLHYWIAVDNATTPNMKILNQVNNMHSKPLFGARGGWSTWSSGRSVEKAFSACMFASNLTSDDGFTLDLCPYVGVNDDLDRDILQRGDFGSTDSGVEYGARVQSRPEIVDDMLSKGGVMAGVLLATPATGVEIRVKAIRDFGIEDDESEALDLTPVGSETQVVIPIDELAQSEARFLQIEFGDVADPSGLWAVNGFAAKVREEESS